MSEPIPRVILGKHNLDVKPSDSLQLYISLHAVARDSRKSSPLIHRSTADVPWCQTHSQSHSINWRHYVHFSAADLLNNVAAPPSMKIPVALPKNAADGQSFSIAMTLLQNGCSITPKHTTRKRKNRTSSLRLHRGAAVEDSHRHQRSSLWVGAGRPHSAPRHHYNPGRATWRALYGHFNEDASYETRPS